jgi:hypothetical protein
MCEETLQNLQDLPTHLQTSHGLKIEKVLECSSCQTVFTSYADFNDHNNEVHTNKCNFCEKKFLGKKGFKQLRPHLISCHMPKVCITCLTTSEGARQSHTTLQIFVDHLTEHYGTEVPIFKCSKCDQGFMTSSGLRQHFDGNHGHRCRLCHGSKVYKNEEALESHISQVHGISKPKNSTCRTCLTVVPSIVDFVTHVLGHGLQLTTCKFCSYNKSKFYAPVEHLPWHMRVIHPQLQPERQVKVQNQILENDWDKSQYFEF